ncbi:hypothetical protein GUITHDRAFT_122392 [Guillardia theta CCMP2712]|uniref:Uncharacterized protein n=1 Tax=Guillardia theta (strain CCMP2712) TaxID=905079 RepID=L1I564_GUITC|nr:hypothetical protein GUITHDRAFT_122392 [Guillardia theta CCMP2712]EKX31403.1 hypothetical protein GUITHDRAFT_122392 [Guillardia theta CCMP2712]|eukprot:XP_005818383.1 hypothetical protein GUITHDRAFT_122392 [Guillardia theta CCMP2712]
MASVGQITGTQVHSGPKHILQCQVSEDTLRMLATDETKDRIHRDKMLYCMHKHELALCCSIPYNTNNNMIFKQKKQPYPPVVTTLGFIDAQTRNLIRAVYNTQTMEQFEETRENVIARAARDPGFKFHLPQFTFQGVVQTQAWATSNFGDTVGSVLVAGFATIMNGHFHAYTGDVVHWYFDFESIMFNDDGTRRRGGHFDVNPVHVDAIDNNGEFYEHDPVRIGAKAGERKDFHEMREYGNYPDMYPDQDRRRGGAEFKRNIIYPKTYHYDGCGYGDRCRVFGRVVNGGRPFEPIDVLIYSQCR